MTTKPARFNPLGMEPGPTSARLYEGAGHIWSPTKVSICKGVRGG